MRYEINIPSIVLPETGQGEKDTTVLPLDEFVEKLENEIKNKLRTHIGAEK